MQVGADSPALQYSEVEMKRTGVQAGSLFAAENGNYESPSQTLMIVFIFFFCIFFRLEKARPTAPLPAQYFCWAGLLAFRISAPYLKVPKFKALFIIQDSSGIAS